MGIESLFETEAGAVWRHFAGICGVPRPSKKEERIVAYLRGIAEANGWEVREDAAMNLVIAVPGRGKLAASPALALQGHTDMVCEKNAGVAHDFDTDPIRPRIVGEWVMATDTTLGADNGVALALGLALGESDMPDRPPLELIFTSDEETGLNGATALDASMVTARRVLNLDAEEDGGFIIGCAGGSDVQADFPYLGERGAEGAVSVTVAGLRGGHSGVQIHEGRRNAMRALAGLIVALEASYPDVTLHGISGGNKRNAIPREARALFSGAPVAAVTAAAAALQVELRETEPEAVVTVSESGSPSCAKVLPFSVLRYMLEIPHDVINFDPNYPTLVQTSNSMGVAEQTSAGLRLHCNARSSSDTARAGVVAQIQALASECGGSSVVLGNYPGWDPNPHSALLAHGVNVYSALFGTEPRVEGIHAGLEAGILGARLGTNELLAYGPTIESPHSPDERLSIPSLAKVWRWLQQYASSLP